jgi:hypothetical protein
MPRIQSATPNGSLVEDPGTEGGPGHATCPQEIQKAPSRGHLPRPALAGNGVTYSRY